MFSVVSARRGRRRDFVHSVKRFLSTNVRKYYAVKFTTERSAFNTNDLSMFQISSCEIGKKKTIRPFAGKKVCQKYHFFYHLDRTVMPLGMSARL